MRIQNIYDVDIFIDELNIFKASGVVFLDARIDEGFITPLPTCTLSVILPLDWINKRSIVDGTIIRFDIKSKALDISESLRFRLYDITRLTLEQDFCTVQLNGVLDFPEAFRFYNQFNMYGSTADVFAQVAKTFTLPNEIDPTNDQQLWVSGENNLVQHLNYVAQFGWIDNTSAMIWALDRHKILLYKNLTGLFRNRNQKCWAFIQSPDKYDAKEKIFGYSQASLNIRAGSENIKHEGYGGDDSYFELLGYTWRKPSARQVVAESNLINISKEVSQGLATNWYPFDVGNFHKNYWLARKQNTRILSTYSTYAVIQCQHLMNYRLGQVVKFVLMDSQDDTRVINMGSGLYMITKIDIHITSNSVTSIVNLAMQGLNGQAITRETY